MDYYVYLHRKKITGEVFYIGKGKGRRSKVTKNRSKFWNAIVEKHGYTIEIVCTGVQEWYAIELERELIAFHGRRDLGDGTLVNLTDGGDGISGYKLTKEHKQKLSTCYKDHDKTEYTFKNKYTDEIFIGTRSSFNRTNKIDTTCLFSTTRKVFHTYGWYVASILSEKEIDMLFNGRVAGNNYRSDKTIFNFVNIFNGEEFTGLRKELERFYGVDVSPIFKQGAYSASGWTTTVNIEKYGIDKILEIRNKSVTDMNVYTFIHKDGDMLIGTRAEFKLRIGTSANPFFHTRRTKSVKGWSLVKPNQLAISEPAC